MTHVHSVNRKVVFATLFLSEEALNRRVTNA